MKSTYMSLVLLIAICGYIAAQILSDITSLKIINLFNFAIDGGTFLYPITFTLRDLIHKNSNKKTAQQVIIIAGFINVFMVLFFQFIINMPSDSSFLHNEEMSIVLGSIWRITIASIVAEIASELVDTEAYQFFVDRITIKYQWGRVLFSNFFSIPLDSLVFCLIAFIGTMPLTVVFSIVLSNIIIKGVVTIFSMPLIYLGKEEK